MLNVEDVLEILSIPLLESFPRAAKCCAHPILVRQSLSTPGERGGARLFRCSKAAEWRSPDMTIPSDRKGLLASCSDGGRHETHQFLQRRARAGSQERLQFSSRMNATSRQVRSDRHSSGRNNAVIAKHFPVDQEGIKIKMERGEVVSTLEVEVEIPTPMCPSFPLPAKAVVPGKHVLSEERRTACADEPDTEWPDGHLSCKALHVPFRAQPANAAKTVTPSMRPPVRPEAGTICDGSAFI